MDKKDEEKEGEDKSQPRSIRDRRRPREKRRSTGVSFWTQDVSLPHTLARSSPPTPHAVASPHKSAQSRWRAYLPSPPLLRITLSNVFHGHQGDENDPDQQSDSEEGSTKGEPQVCVSVCARVRMSVCAPLSRCVTLTFLLPSLPFQSDRLSRNEISSLSSDRNDSLSSRGYGESRRTYSSRLDRDDATDYKKVSPQLLRQPQRLKSSAVIRAVLTGLPERMQLPPLAQIDL